MLHQVVVGSAFLAFLAPMFSLAYRTNDLLVIRSSWFFGFVSIMGASWLLLALSDRRYRPKLSHPVVAGVTLFLVVLLLNLLVSVDVHNSFWGTKERMTGVISYIYFWTWFVGLVTVFKKTDWIRLLSLSVFFATLFAVKGMADWVLGDMVLRNQNRIASIFGNPLFFAQFLVPNIFIAGYLMVKQPIHQTRLVWCIPILLMFFALGLTVSRAAFLGLILAGFTGIIFIAKELPRKLKNFVLIGLLLTVVIAVAGFILMRSPSIREVMEPKLSYSVGRVFYSDNTTDRFISWKIAGLSVQDKPVFGWGHNAFSQAFDSHFTPNLDGIVLQQPWFDRVHNQPLEILVTLGITGMIAWILFWCAVLYTIFLYSEKLHSLQERLSAKLLLLLFVAYFVQLFFLFELFLSSIIIYMLLGYIVFLTKDYNVKFLSFINIDKLPEIKLRAFYVPLFIVALIPIEIYLSIYPYQAVNAAAQAVIYIDGDLGDPTEFIEQTLLHNTHIRNELAEEIFRELNAWAMVFQVHTPEVENIVVPLSAILAEDARAHPNNYRSQWFAANALVLAAFYDEERYAQSNDFAMKAVELAPGRPEIHATLGDLSLAANEPEQALDYFQNAMGLLPIRSRTFTKERVSLQFRYALAYGAMNRLDLAFDQIHKVDALGLLIYEDARFILVLRDHYKKGNSDNDVIEYTTKVISTFPNHPEVLEAGARIYNEAESYDAARKVLEFLSIVDAQHSDRLTQELGL